MSEETKKDLEKKESEMTEDEQKIAKSIADTVLRLVDAKASEKNKVDEEKKTKEIADVAVLTKDMVTTMSDRERTGEFIKAMINGDKVRLKVLSEGTNADGGFLVPQEWYNTIIADLRDLAFLVSKVTRVPMTTNQMDLAQLASRPQTYWQGEQVIKETSTATFSEISLTPYSHAVIVVFTKQLVADASIGLPQGIIDYVTKLVVEEMAANDDWMIMRGSGATQPTGYETYRAAGTITSVATGANIASYTSMVDVWARLGQRYRQKAVWIMNNISLRNVMNIVDTTNRPIFVADPTGNLPGTALGRPVLECNALPNGVVYLADPSGYYWGVREGISVMQSEEASITRGVSEINLFERNMIAIRVKFLPLLLKFGEHLIETIPSQALKFFREGVTTIRAGFKKLFETRDSLSFMAT